MEGSWPGALLLAAVLGCGGAAAQSVARPAQQRPYVPPSGPEWDCRRLGDAPRAGTLYGVRLRELADRLPEALKACEEAVRLQPQHPELHLGLARVRALAGDAAGALEATRRVLELRPSSERAMTLQGALQARSNPAAATALFREAVRHGDRIAAYNLGVLWANGLGVQRNPQDAANFFRDAARRGDPVAMLVTGQLHASGTGTGPDRAAAEDWWRKAAETLLPEAVPDPARLVLAEPVLDTQALLAWYREQAQAGAPWAQAWLAVLHEDGLWVPRDPTAAAFWYMQAGEAGHHEAQMRMANLYRLGIGVPQDMAESRRWAAMPQIAFCRKRVQEMEGADECDRLAGDPYEPARTVPGLHGDCVVHHAQAAVAACRRAMAEHPGEVRFHAQYARALAHAHRFEDAAREAKLAAGKGSTPAMILLGAMHQRGLGLPRDPKAALAWFRKAADAGDRRGSAIVVSSVQQGVGIDPASAQASELIAAEQQRMMQQATIAADPVPTRAQQGDARAQYEMALRHEQRRDYPAAIEWYTRAARQGYPGAAMALAQMHELGIGVGRDPAQAIARYTVLADQGHAEARYRLALLLAQQGDVQGAIERLRKGVEHDDHRAMVELGETYDKGRGVPPDPARAVPLYEKAADRSHWAKARLGAMALTGTGMPRDLAKARRSLERAADAGEPSAMNNLGFMAEKGLGEPVDYRRARDLYLKARYDTPAAQGNLEQLHEKDLGAPSDPAALAAWYRPAADAEIASAQWRLGRLYLQGRGGVARDEREAVRWLQRAIEQGHQGARRDGAEAAYALARRHARGDGVQRNEQEEAHALLTAASLGHPLAIAQVAARFGPSVLAMLAQGRRPAQRLLVTGIATEPRQEQIRRLSVRVAGVGSIQAVALDAGIGNVYTVIPWTPIDEKNRKAEASRR